MSFSLQKTCRDEEMVAIEEALRKLETLAAFSEKWVKSPFYKNQLLTFT